MVTEQRAKLLQVSFFSPEVTNQMQDRNASIDGYFQIHDWAQRGSNVLASLMQRFGC